MRTDAFIISNIDDEAKEPLRIRHRNSIIRKVDRRLIPFFVILEINAYLNRTNIGHAKLMGFDKDLDLSDYEVHWAISIFFLAYLIFEIPSIVLMRFLGSTTYLSVSMVAWGIFALSMAFVPNFTCLMVVRALLGMAQSGYFPGIIIYISWWYCKREQTMRIVIVFAAAIAASALGGILAYCFTYMDGMAGLEDWQWMFLLESAPIVPLGIITFLFLDNIPNTVRWLKPIDQQTLTNYLLQDADVNSNELMQSSKSSCRQLFNVFTDWRVYLFGVIGIGNLAVTKYLTTYLPSLVHFMGYHPAEAHLLTIPPYTVACICCLLVGYSSSRRNEHVYHQLFCLAVALLGFILWVTLTENGRVALYISTCIGCCGMLSAFPLLLCWLTHAINGRIRRAMAIGFVMGIGQIGGVVLPLIYDDDTPSNRRGHFLCIGLICASLIATLILHFCPMIQMRFRKFFAANHRQISSSEQKNTSRY